MIRGLGVALFVSLSAGAAWAAEPAEVALAKTAEVMAKAPIIEALVGMAAVDQEFRTRLIDARKDASPEQRAVLDNALDVSLKAMDNGHERRLQAILDAQSGWFPISVYGERAANAALTIVNHSDNLAFRKEALRRMEPLLGTPELSNYYANIYDRTALMDGRQQRYGTQQATNCVNGAYAVPANVEDPAGLEARRAALKLPPMMEYLASLAQMYGRCDVRPGGGS